MAHAHPGGNHTAPDKVICTATSKESPPASASHCMVKPNPAVEASSEDIKEFDTVGAQKKVIETALKKYREK